MHNISAPSETYTIDIKHLDSHQKFSQPISNEGYEVPVKIYNNEYLELGSDTCGYLDLSPTQNARSITGSRDSRDSEPESIAEETNLLYCNMSPEQL